MIQNNVAREKWVPPNWFLTCFFKSFIEGLIVFLDIILDKLYFL